MVLLTRVCLDDVSYKSLMMTVSWVFYSHSVQPFQSDNVLVPIGRRDQSHKRPRLKQKPGNGTRLRLGVSDHMKGRVQASMLHRGNG